MRRLDLENIKRNLERRIDEYETLLVAWKNVSFPTKKDGSPFKNLARNFEGATLTGNKNTLNRQLIVYTHSRLNGYIDDGIDCYGYTTTMNPTTLQRMKDKPQNVGDFYYIYDLDDIKEEINEKIKFLEERIIAMKKELLVTDKAYNEYKQAIQNAIDKLEETTVIDNDKTLFYMIYDYSSQTYYC